MTTFPHLPSTAPLALAGLLNGISQFLQSMGVKTTDLEPFYQAIPEKFKDVREFAKESAKGDSSTTLAKRVLLANLLARAEEKPEKTSPKGLLSPFSHLKDGTNGSFYIPAKPLSLEEPTLFPKPNAPSPKEYELLLNGFIGALKGIDSFQDTASYVESFQALLYQYGWCLPSPNMPSADISLYDQNRITGALAASMSVLGEDVIQKLLQKRDATPVATFIEGDISGIQKFIYAVPMQGATKQLQARSLYLQLLTECIARFILHRLGLSITNLVYVGGGHFYIVAQPNIEQELNALQDEIERLLLKHHDGEVYIAIGRTTLNADDFSPIKFKGKWDELKTETGKSKSKRYHRQPQAVLENLFVPRSLDGELLARSKDREGREGDIDANGATSALGNSFEEFATALRSAQALTISYLNAPLQSKVGDFGALFGEIGFEIGLIYTRFNEIRYPNRSDSLERVVALGLSGTLDARVLAGLKKHFGCPVASSLRYTVSVTPMIGDNVRPVDFDELNQASTGIKRLGVLRMDVDDLGQLFKGGFVTKDKKPSASLTRVASLSNALSLFFEGWVGEICREANRDLRPIVDVKGNQQNVGTVYTVYSGGDDLFIVGSWDILPTIAKRIQDDLAKYTAENPSVHISAGITLHTGKYPLFLAAEEADKALKQAKNLDGKNAIHFLGQAVKWETWNSTILPQTGELVSLISDEKVNRSLLRILMQLHAEYRLTAKGYEKSDKNNKGKVIWGAWMWHMAYQLTRFTDRIKDNALKARIVTLHKSLKDDQLNGIVWAGLAARWADAFTRDNDKQEN